MKTLIISCVTALTLTAGTSVSMWPKPAAAAASHDEVAYQAFMELGIYISELDTTTADALLPIMENARMQLAAQGEALTAASMRNILRTAVNQMRTQIGISATADLLALDAMAHWRFAAASSSVEQWIQQVQANPFDLLSLNIPGIFDDDPDLPESSAMSGTEGGILVAAGAILGAIAGGLLTGTPAGAAAGAAAGAVLALDYVASSERNENGAEGAGEGDGGGDGGEG